LIGIFQFGNLWTITLGMKMGCPAVLLDVLITIVVKAQ
jgi:hypothetical protein